MKACIAVIALLITGMAAIAGGNVPTNPMENKVRHELVTLPWLNVFDNITYRVEGGTVTLSGQVTRPVLRTSAERVVKKIEGVETVDNRIEVLPLSNHDDRLRHQLYRAIYAYPSLHKYSMPVLKPIRIIVKNGNVTLEGIVDNETDRNIANLRASGVHGVFSVTNNLRVAERT